MKLLLLLTFLLVPTMVRAETCVASVYDTSEKWGTVTASGIPLNDRRPTMAHRHHVLRGWMRITNLKTGKVTVLQVTDRGPYKPGRCADLSRAAAKKVGIKGLGKVKVEPL